LLIVLRVIVLRVEVAVREVEETRHLRRCPSQGQRLSG
jgi:hypothetical protein